MKLKTLALTLLLTLASIPASKAWVAYGGGYRGGYGGLGNGYYRGGYGYGGYGYGGYGWGGGCYNNYGHGAGFAPIYVPPVYVLPPAPIYVQPTPILY